MLEYHITTVLVRRSRPVWNAAAIPGIRAAFSAASSSTYTMSSSSADAPPSGETLKQQKPVQQGPMTYFPLGYKDAAYQWWTSVTPLAAERNVLSMIPHIREAVDSLTVTAPSSLSSPPPPPKTSPSSPPSTAITKDPFGIRTWRSSQVQLSGKNRALHEICVERQDEEVQETLVMVHGYGAGLGFFFKNLEPITRIPGLKLYALDMLGMGNSSRPPFKIHAREKEDKVREAEDWFIDALEEWRQARKIERFTLLGHSLGGYLAVSYAIKYPGHLKKLILASPVGIPEDPYAVSASLPEPGESTVQNEFIQDQQQVVTDSGAAKATKDLNNNSSSSDASSKNANGAPKRPLPSWLVWLWDANISPFSIVRMAGPFGPRFVSGWSSRRFNHLPPEEARALHDYSFSIFKQKGSGEYALAYILAPGAYARRPVINRIHQVGRQPLPVPVSSPSSSPPLVSSSDHSTPTSKETGIPIVFMYGENDWMDVAGGLAAEQKLKDTQAQVLRHATDEERRNERGSVKVVIVPKAGHHLYLDNADYFNELLRKEMEETKAQGEKDRRAAAAAAATSSS